MSSNTALEWNLVYVLSYPTSPSFPSFTTILPLPISSRLLTSLPSLPPSLSLTLFCYLPSPSLPLLHYLIPPSASFFLTPSFSPFLVTFPLSLPLFLCSSSSFPLHPCWFTFRLPTSPFFSVPSLLSLYLHPPSPSHPLSLPLSNSPSPPFPLSFSSGCRSYQELLCRRHSQHLLLSQSYVPLHVQ